MVRARDSLPRKERPSFFVIGLAPRKKLNQMDLALVAAGQFELPTIIIKQEPVVDRARVFVAAIKDLEHVQPYTVAADLMKPGNGDRLIVVHIHNGVRGYFRLFHGLLIRFCFIVSSYHLG